MDYPGVWGMQALGYQQFAAGTIDTAQSLTIPAGTQVIILEAEAQVIRFRDDGTAPTAAVGMPLQVAESYQYVSPSMSRLQLISAVAGGILNVLYYGTKTL
jgi:hypothetical protein